MSSWTIALPVASDSSLLPISAFSAASAGSRPVLNQLLLSVWGLGFLFVIARIAIGNWMVWQAAKAGTHREEVVSRTGVKIPVIESAVIQMPLLWGATNTQILVPVGLRESSAAERALVRAHETAHAGQRDSLFQLLAQLAGAIYWFHPLIWIAVAKLRRESEMACDDSVLRLGILPSSYADLLLEAADAFSTNASIVPVTLCR